MSPVIRMTLSQAVQSRCLSLLATDLFFLSCAQMESRKKRWAKDDVLLDDALSAFRKIGENNSFQSASFILTNDLLGLGSVDVIDKRKKMRLRMTARQQQCQNCVDLLIKVQLIKQENQHWVEGERMSVHNLYTDGSRTQSHAQVELPLMVSFLQREIIHRKQDKLFYLSQMFMTTNWASALVHYLNTQQEASGQTNVKILTTVAINFFSLLSSPLDSILETIISQGKKQVHT